MLAIWLLLTFGAGILVGFACAMSVVLVVMDGLKHIDCAKVSTAREQTRKAIGLEEASREPGDIIKRNKTEEVMRSMKSGDIALADVLEDA